MSRVGFQEFMIVGSRFYLQRDDDEDGTKHPFMDLGVIMKVTPNISSEKVELKDSDGGLKRLVDEAFTGIDEAYDIQCNNMNLENLALMFLAKPPKSFVQAAAEVEVTQHVHPGRLLKLLDANGENVYRAAIVTGLMVRDAAGDLTEVELTAISKAAKTITVTGSLATEFDPGDKVTVRRQALTNVLNAKTYTVVSAAGVGPTVLTVEEEPAADEAAISGLLIYKADAGDAGTIYQEGVDWETVSIDRGIIRIIDGGAIAAEDDIVVIYQTTAITGNRLINPHDLLSEVKGKMALILGRENNAAQTVREARVSITPNGMDLNDSDFSNMTLTVKIISTQDDPATPAGRLLQFKGTLPSTS